MKPEFLKVLGRVAFAAVLPFCAQAHVQAQNARICGSVREAGNAQPMPFANVVLVKASDSSQVMGMASDDSGAFCFKRIPAGTYFVQVSVLGYHRNNSERFTVDAAHTDIRLEPVSLTSQAVQLDAVVVRAKRPVMELKPGKITMNISQSLASQADNAYEMLKKFPGVTIDKDDNISLNGRGGVLVLINDRDPHLSGQNLASYLRGMPGNNIDKIEVMNNPSSKYDAEGTGGIINIKTVRSQASGFSGSVNAGAGYNGRFQGNGGFDLNYRHKKFTIYANASVYQWNNNNYAYSISDYADGSRKEANGRKGERRNPLLTNHGLSFFGQGGIDYYPTKKDVLSLSYDGGYYSGGGDVGNFFSRFYPQAGVDSVAYSFLQEGNSHWSGQNHDVNLNYEHTFDTVFNRKLTLNFDYLHNLSSGGGENTVSYFAGDFAAPLYRDAYYTSQPFTSDIYTFKADYEHPFSDRTTLEAGLKFSYVDNITRNTYRDTLGTSRDHFLYDEAIGAAYVMVNHTFKTQTSLQVGLRAEYTHTKGNNVSMDSVTRRGYIRPFPNITVSHPIDPKNTLSLSYRYRLSRPDYEDLNPFFIRNTATNFRGGNPYLDPQYSHDLSLSYSFNYKFFATVSYLHTDDAYSSVSHFDSIITRTTPVNVGKRDQVSVNLSTNLTFFNIWRVMANVGGNYGRSETTYEGKKVTSEIFEGYYWLSTEVDVHKQVTLSLWSWGSLPSKTEFTKTRGQVGGGVGVKAFFFNKTLTLSANVDGSFMPYITASSYPDARGGYNRDYDWYDWDRVRGNIRITYRFGNNKMMNRAPRQKAKSEEASRIGGGGGNGGGK